MASDTGSKGKGEFADHPLTMGEVRSDRNCAASDWAPRDVLVSMLRKIDRGDLEPTDLVVCYREDGEHATGWWMSTKSPLTVVGMLTQTATYLCGSKS